MPKKTETSVSFEQALQELESIVRRLEGGDMPLEDALNEFEKGVKLAKSGQQTLQKAEQRVQILMKPDSDAELTTFTPDSH
ncbi:exodeoxyribonuclease VII small subunit [Tatumella saanichensis]|uniref:exodeoxyribonuclease VII small subunit n=1 Tax=Tatumella saanichensis TaxID=480813 RepID=UPI0004A33AB9|nr:exodeoxyribonuclease VII small subunit [Tatumella saanichensis]